MSDDLVKRLRDWERVWPEDDDKPDGHLFHEAADRIEALEAKLAEYESDQGWHYQLMKHTTPDGHTYYAVHEYYDLETGPAWTENPITLDGESIDDVRRMLIRILKDLDTHGVKDYDADKQ